MDEKKIREAVALLNESPVPRDGRYIWHPEHGVLPIEDPRAQEYINRMRGRV